MNKLTQAATLTLLVIVFVPSARGQRVEGFPSGLIEASDGNFYGTTHSGGEGGAGTVFRLTRSGEVTTLHSFGGLDGQHPLAALIEASDGNFYGTTSEGGTAEEGTLFRLTPTGEFSSIHSFEGPDGRSPWSAPLIEASDGHIYGTTIRGGEADRGTVFRLAPSGELTTIYSFEDGRPSGPRVAFFEASDGNLYGAVRRAVFKLAPSGECSILGSVDCGISSLIEGSDGNLYGTDPGDELADTPGYVFAMSRSGETLRRSDFNGRNGFEPTALIETSEGGLNFYGITAFGPGFDGGGTLFRYGRSGIRVIHEFQPRFGSPRKLLKASDGALYVTTNRGVFRMSFFRRGDCNDDGTVDISDPVFVLNHLIGGGSGPSCLQTADANDDNVVGVADPIYQLNHLFGSGPALPAPVGECGADPTPAANAENELSCEAYPPCEA